MFFFPFIRIFIGILVTITSYYGMRCEINFCSVDNVKRHSCSTKNHIDKFPHVTVFNCGSSWFIRSFMNRASETRSCIFVHLQSCASRPSTPRWRSAEQPDVTSRPDKSCQPGDMAWVMPDDSYTPTLVESGVACFSWWWATRRCRSKTSSNLMRARSRRVKVLDKNLYSTLFQAPSPKALPASTAPSRLLQEVLSTPRSSSRGNRDMCLCVFVLPDGLLSHFRLWTLILSSVCRRFGS